MRESPGDAQATAPRSGRGGKGSSFAAALSIGLALAVLLPEADPGALLARGASRLLAGDLDRALAAPAPALAPGTLFGALHGLLPARAPTRLALELTADGAVWHSPAVERAFAAQLRRYEVARRAEAPPIRLAPHADAPELRVALAFSTAGGRVAWTAELAHGERRVAVAPGGDFRIPGRGALLPPLLAVCVALLLRRTLLALFAGIYAGALLGALSSGSGWAAPLRGLWDVFAVYLWRELFDTFRIEIIGFTVSLIAMVGVMSRAGGMRGLLELMLGLARSARSALLLTFGTGLLIFFDDYANCMLVGSTMRPLTDARRISREKLAYVVDSTAAPVVGISLLSTWIAFMVSIYSAQLPDAGIGLGGYAVFLQTLPYRFYCLFTLLLVLLVILSGRDFGPMAAAEARAATTGALVRPGGRPPISNALAGIEPAPGVPIDWRRAALPIGLTLLVTLVDIFAAGGGLERLARRPAELLDSEVLLEILLAGSGAGAIFVGAVAGLLCALFLAGSNALRAALLAGVVLAAVLGAPLRARLGADLGEAAAGYAAALLAFALGAAAAAALARAARLPTRRPHVSAPELARAAAGSIGTLAFAVALLFEAWMIGAVCRDVGTADYLVALLSGALPGPMLPVLLFAVACAVSFATGSSWSTMSILLPNVVALAASLGAETQLGTHGMVVVCISAVLEGSIFGDHCSPISDTTVLSSVASGSDHIDHVRTQAPYALAAAAAALGCGYAPLLLLPGWSAGAGLALGAALLAGAVGLLGRRPPAA